MDWGWGFPTLFIDKCIKIRAVQFSLIFSISGFYSYLHFFLPYLINKCIIFRLGSYMLSYPEDDPNLPDGNFILGMVWNFLRARAQKVLGTGKAIHILQVFRLTQPASNRTQVMNVRTDHQARFFIQVGLSQFQTRPAQVAPQLKPGQIDRIPLIYICILILITSGGSDRIQREIDLLRDGDKPDHIPDQDPPSRSKNCCQECELLGWSDHNDAIGWRVFGWCLLGEVLCNSCFFHHLSHGNLHIYAFDHFSLSSHSILTWWAASKKIEWCRKVGPAFLILDDIVIDWPILIRPNI